VRKTRLWVEICL